MADFTTCPSRDNDEEVARQYANGVLSPDDARAFEAHLAECHRCQRAVEYAAGVTATLRGAVQDAEASRWSRISWPIWTISTVVLVGLAVALLAF